MMTIPENIRDVAIKVTTALPASLLFVILVFIVHDALLLYAMHDLQLERIKALVDIFNSCMPVKH